MKTIFFDIETGALPESELGTLLPPFDPAEVKTGNIKDPEKIAAKIAEAELNHKRDFTGKAALDPLTGRVVAIGLIDADTGEFRVIGHDDEAQTLREFWDACRGEMGRINQMIGFNTFQFDLPFLIRRSWKHRVAIPFGIRRGRYWANELIDLREGWQLGDRMVRGSLDAIAKHLGVGAKNGEGKEFAALWQSDRAKAMEYLRNDLELTAKVAEVLGHAAVRQVEEAY
ncbi:MAG: ribonuclease H-like domain-containing protein [Verrucomicrobia bacterium]|nr:ribonuclease H-like domain-containing protein [Verrucomicrobiota bacterium]